MGWRFYRRIKILPGITLNFSKSGPSISIGRRGAHFTFGSRETRETLGIPGTGVSYTTTDHFRLWSSLALLIVVATIGAAIIAIAVIYGWQ
jgi:hypothetical protein